MAWTTPLHVTSGVAAGLSAACQSYETDLLYLGGPWVSYSPGLAGFTAGNGTFAAQYLLIGKTCIFEAQFTFGSTSAAASAKPAIGLPPATPFTGLLANLEGLFVIGGARYNTVTYISGGSIVLAVPGTNGVEGNASTTVPATWGTGSLIQVSGLYQTL